MSSITRVFSELKAKSEGALIGYVMCGDPTPKHTTAIANALVKGGVDILELGLPFSDPIADGPIIQAASARALNAGTTSKIVLELANAIKKEHDTPVVIMTYFNPVFKMGLQTFFSKAQRNRVDGVIVPDLPIEEADEYLKAANATNIEPIFLAAPSTTNERLSRIIQNSSGFLYLVSRFGVTGPKTSVEESTLSLIRRVHTLTEGRIPLAVGFGVSKPEHVKSIIKAGAEGVIVGSALVNIVSKNKSNEEKLEELEGAVRSLKEAAKK